MISSRAWEDPSLRLRLLALATALAVLAGWLLSPRSLPLGFHASLAAAVVWALLGLLAGFAASRRSWAVARLGALWMLGLVVALAAAETWVPILGTVVRGVSWTVVVVLVVPLFLALPFRVAAVTAALAVLLIPITHQVAIFLEAPPIPPALWVPLYSPPVLAAILVVVLRRGEQRQQAPTMGAYRLESVLGKGGMGEVWRGRHVMLGRPAAVKLVRPEVVRPKLGQDPQGLFRRFEREARAMARLSSPHTVTLFDFGYTPDGAFYYVMELLDGQDLETLTTRFGPQPAPRVVHWLRQACASLSEAHALGLIHRDIKPANLFACRVGGVADFVKVLDFGLVLMAEGEATKLTADGLAAGTPEYMAPELASGMAIGPATDLYALGCVAYRLLTGRPPFVGRSPLAILRGHLELLPEPPSRHGSVASDLEAVVLQCLEKLPERRFTSAQALSEALDRCADAGRWSAADAELWWAGRKLDGGS